MSVVASGYTARPGSRPKVETVRNRKMKQSVQILPALCYNALFLYFFCNCSTLSSTLSPCEIPFSKHFSFFPVREFLLIINLLIKSTINLFKMINFGAVNSDLP